MEPPTGFEVDHEATQLYNGRASFVLTDHTLPLLATKEGDMFLYADPEGNLRSGELGMGLYFRDTRFLSEYEMKVCDVTPVLLSSSAERAYMSYVDLTNPDLVHEGAEIPAQTLNIRRIRVIKGRMFERIRFKNYNDHRIRVRVTFTFGADFADIFHVRGLIPERTGVFYKPLIEEQSITFAHTGEDEQLRRTRIDLGTRPAAITAGVGRVTVAFDLDLVGHQTKLLSFTIDPVIGQDGPDATAFDAAVHQLRRSYDEWDHECTSIYTDNEVFNTLLQRGRRDLRALITETPEGRYIAAGIPWYVAAFGRDSIITAHQILMLNPTPAKDTLRLLAAYQGDRVDGWRGAD